MWGLKELIQIKWSFENLNPITPSPSETQSVASLCTGNKPQLLSMSCKYFMIWPCPSSQLYFKQCFLCSLSSSHTALFSVKETFLSPRSSHLLHCCPIGSVSCKFPSFFGVQLQCYLFKEDSAVHLIRSLALFPSECLDSRRSRSFISLRFHYWSPGWKGKLLKCRGCTCLFFTVSSEPDTVLGTEHRPRDVYLMNTW